MRLIEITEFIDIVHPKLKKPTSISYEVYKGIDLKKTGYAKTMERIEDHKMYRIPVPVEVNVDHKRKLKLAYLRGGKAAVRTYLSKFIPKKELDIIMSVLS